MQNKLTRIGGTKEKRGLGLGIRFPVCFNTKLQADLTSGSIQEQQEHDEQHSDWAAA